MGLEKDIRIFTGGMNKDVSPHLLEVGKYIDSIDFHIGKTDNGVDLTVENVKSTYETQNSSQETYVLPSGINRVIAAWDDKKGNRTIIFLWNSDGSHRLIQYNYATQVISTILEDNSYSSAVGWSSSAVSYSWGGAVILNSVYYVCNYSHTSSLFNSPEKNSILWTPIGDYLDFAEYNFPQVNGIYRDDELLVYWTDANGEPKYINIDRYINGTHPTIHRKEYFYQIPPAPTLSIRTAEYTSSGGVNVMTNAYWQFRYQYEYWDGRKSAWSPISKIPMPTKNLRGRNAAVDNFITMKVPCPPYEDTGEKSPIKKINVAAMDVENGNTGTWYLAEEIDATKERSVTSIAYSDITLTYYNFTFGGQVKAALNQNDLNQLFSWIPNKARSQEIVDENTLVLGGITEGYNAISPNSVNFTSLDVNTTDDEITVIGHGFTTGESVVLTNVSGTSPTGLNINSGYYAIVTDADTVQLAESYDDAISGTAVNITATGTGTSQLSNFKAEIEWNWTVIASAASLNVNSGSVSVFKRGHRYIFGIVYSDGNGRLSDVITSSDLDVIVPFYDAVLNSNIGGYVAPIPTIKIYHAAPTWAKTYHIVYSRSLTAELEGSTPSFRQFLTWDALTYGAWTGTEWPMHNIGYIFFGLGYVSNTNTAWQDDVGNLGFTNKFDGNSMSNPYSFNNGDRVRIIMALRPNNTPDNTYAEDIWDTEILEYTTQHGWLLLNGHDTSGTAYTIPNYGADAKVPIIKVRRGFDAETYIGIPDNTGTYPPECYIAPATTLYSTFLIEAYTPKGAISEDNIFYYELGEDFLCGYDFSGNWVHLSNSISSANNINGSYSRNTQTFSNTDVTIGSDEINIALHGYSTGEAVIYSVTSGTTLAGLTDGGTYYVIYVDEDDIQLASSLANALAGTQIDITSAPTGTFSIVNTPTQVRIVDGGDCYLNRRNADPIVDGVKLVEPAAAGIPADSSKQFSGGYTIETSSIEDYLVKRSNNSGRPNIIAPDSSQHKETERPSTIRLSQPLIQGTNINGFGTFYDADFAEYNVNYGWVNKLHAQSEYLTIYQEIRTSIIPIGRVQWSDALGNNTVALSSNLLGKIQYIPQEFGIGDNATSHCAYGGNQYFYDLRRSAICKVVGGEIEVISEKGNDTWIDGITSTTSGYVYKPKVFGTYDQEFMEYVSCVDYSAIGYGTVTAKDVGNNQITVTLPYNEWKQFTFDNVTIRFYNGSEYEEVTATGQPTGAIGSGQALLTVSNIGDFTVNDAVTLFQYAKDTIAYSDKYDIWTGRYSFNPEMFGSAGVNMMSFNNGTSYVHNEPSVTTYGSFYGTQYNPEIKVPFNANPDSVKQPLTVEIKSNNSNWLVSEVSNNNGQASTIPNSFFVRREGVLSAPILRDTNTLPSISNALTRGDKLKGEYHTLTFKNTATSLVRLFNASIKYIASYIP